MMKLFTTNRSVTIKIDEPCSEDWEAMHPVPGGRHCDVCAKRVTDFTGMSAGQLANFFNANGKLCGRINSNFLNKPLPIEQPKKGGVLGLVLRAAVLVGITVPAQAKATGQYAIHHNNVIPADEPEAMNIKIIINVKDKATGKPLQYSSIQVNQGTVLWNDGFTDSSGYYVVDRRIEKPNDSLVEIVVKSHFYHDKTVSQVLNDNNEYTVNVELDREDIAANVVYGVVGGAQQYDERALSVLFGKNRIEVFGHPEIGVDVNNLGEYKLYLPDSLLGKRVYINRVQNGSVIHTNGIDVTEQAQRMDFIDAIWVADIEGPPIITYGGTSIITYNWDFKIPFFSISGLPYIIVTTVNWTGTEMYVRTPFTRRNLPLYKSHWFRSGNES